MDVFQFCFGGIQFNTALKQSANAKRGIFCFGGIQFNTALKPILSESRVSTCFGGIQFNTALKHGSTNKSFFCVLEAFNSTQL